VVLVAGDVFHSSRPSNTAILHAFRQFVRIRTALPKTRVVIAAGDHDIPRSTESGNIMGLFEQIDVSVATQEPRAFTFDELDLAVLAVPDVGAGRLPQLETSRRHNILIVHADIDDVVP